MSYLGAYLTIDPRWLTDDVRSMARTVLADGFTTDKLPILADALDEAGCDSTELIVALRTGEFGKYGEIDPELVMRFVGYAIPTELEGYDWAEAFAYAGEMFREGEANVSPALPTSNVPLTPFSRWDVVRVVASSEGENDGPNWLCCGELRDGRFFALDAGCDYTGWD